MIFPATNKFIWIGCGEGVHDEFSEGADSFHFCFPKKKETCQ